MAANKPFDLWFRRDEVHALLGDNGAGKSTLIKMISGAARADAGTVVLDGEDRSSLDPAGTLSRGIAAIHQEFSLFPNLTVAEKVFFGRQITKRGLIDRAAMETETARTLHELGTKVAGTQPVCQLSANGRIGQIRLAQRPCPDHG